MVKSLYFVPTEIGHRTHILQTRSYRTPADETTHHQLSIFRQLFQIISILPSQSYNVVESFLFDPWRVIYCLTPMGRAGCTLDLTVHAWPQQKRLTLHGHLFSHCLVFILFWERYLFWVLLICIWKMILDYPKTDFYFLFYQFDTNKKLSLNQIPCILVFSGNASLR